MFILLSIVSTPQVKSLDFTIIAQLKPFNHLVRIKDYQQQKVI